MWAVDQKWIISHVFFEAFDEKIEDSNLVTYLRLKQVFPVQLGVNSTSMSFSFA